MQQLGRGRFQRIVFALGVVGALLFTLVVWGVMDMRRVAWQQASNHAVNLVTALERDVERTFGTYDLSLQAVLRSLGSPGLERLSPDQRRDLLFDGAIQANNLGAMFVMDAAGHIVYDSDQVVPRAGDFADRDYFAVHRDRADAGLFISAPYWSRLAGEWSIAISRRVTGPDGGFAGVVVGSVRYSYFRQLFAKLDVGTRGSIVLAHIDGHVLYRMPYAESDIGRDVRGNAIFRGLEVARSGLTVDTSTLDGRRRLSAFARAGDLPFVLSVNTSVDSIMAAWKVKALVAGGMSALLVMVWAVLVWVMSGQLRRRQRAEAESARIAAVFKANFDSAGDALFLVDIGEAGEITYSALNPVAERVVGVSSAEAAGRTPHELNGPVLGAQLVKSYLRCAATGESQSMAVVLDRPGGRLELQSLLSPIFGQDGQVTQILATARDVTEQNRQDALRLQSAKMEAVGRLTAGVAHDFNNYLQAITGCLEVLSADFLRADGEGQEIAAVAQRAARSGGQVTHRLLAFSRQQVLQPRRVNVATLLRQTRQLAGAGAINPNVRTKIAVEPFTDDIVADPTQAESCLLNLLLNAAEAMPDGGNLVLHARNARPEDGLFGTLAPGKHVILAVHDTGRGMDEATRSRAFDPFFTTKTFGNGAGLGLSMAQGFCQQTGGDIRLLSGGAVGTRVELWLPAASADMLAGEEAQFNLATIGRGTGRVLMVEDEPDVAVALSATLVSGGFEVVAVTSAVDGLVRLRDRDPYDAVLTDYSMPDMTGIEFLVHAAQIVPEMPTLMLTGFDMASVVMPVLARPPRMLRKPIRRTALLNAVRETIGERAAAA